MTSRSSATFVGGPLDGATYERLGKKRLGKKFPTRLLMPAMGRTHLYVAIYDGRRVTYKHARSMTVEAVA
jgi:hypothetical protein